MRGARPRLITRLAPAPAAVGVAILATAVAACGGRTAVVDPDAGPSATAGATGGATATGGPSSTSRHVRSRPAARAPINVYAHAAADMLSPAVRADPALVYVPNSMSNTVDVIDQRSFRIVAHYRVGANPQHVTPSWDLRTLWVDNDVGNSLTPIDPRTGRPRGRPVPVADPYNMYFTPSGHYAIVVAEALKRLDFRDAQTMRLRRSLPLPGCAGVDHMDFSANGRYAFASCEFAGAMVKIRLDNLRVVARLRLHGGRSQPQDVKLAPDGRVVWVADQLAGGVWEISPRRFRVIGFVRTGAGSHGLYPSRAARYLFVTNRAEGSISVVSFARRRVVAKWRLPPPASPDMGGVSADGKVLWLSGRYNGVVYAIATRNGRLLARIRVGNGPHGIAVWPQPGRYSLGHTGITR